MTGMDLLSVKLFVLRPLLKVIKKRNATKTQRR